jgi:hypothetical protein
MPPSHATLNHSNPTPMANVLRLALVAGVLLMFSQTAGAILQTAQTLDRVTAAKVAQIERLGH